MKRVTLTADEKLIEAARERARAENTTLNEAFRHWLSAYAEARQGLRRYDDVMASLRGRLKVGGGLGRDEMNIR